MPKTLRGLTERLQDRLAEAKRLWSWSHDDWEATEYQRFIDAGGCTECFGHGWVVTWDTMDSMSGCHAEYGICSKCTPEQRKASGIDLSHESRYHSNLGINLETLRKLDPSYASDVHPIFEACRELQDRIDMVFSRNDNKSKGARVVVTRGRGEKKKALIGTVGRVAFISSRTGGILIKDEASWQDRDATGIWVDPKNVDVIDDESMAW